MNQTRLRQVVATVAVVLLVATAGCSGILGGDDGGGDAGPDGQSLTDATGEAVDDAGSYTLETSTVLTQSQQGVTVTERLNSTIRVDFDAQQGVRESTQRRSNGNQTQEVSSTVYTDGNTSYRRQVVGGNTTYDTQEGAPTGLRGIRPVNVSSFTQNYTQLVDALDWEQDGTEDVDGTTATRYTATGVADKELLGLGDNATVESTEGSLLVDDDVIQRMSLSLDVEGARTPNSIDIEIGLSEVGSTTVAEPDWISEAESP